jgi:two-component system, OmpR family, response regulator
VKILVVEDDKKLGSFVRKGLESAGFVVDLCADGDEGFTLATTRSYDALVLDIMLPGRDGLSILRNVRERQIATPVLLLTARNTLNERLDGLNLGADDYLTKPFFIEELIARLHALLRRAAGQIKSLLAHGDVTVNLLTREVKRGGEVVDLTAREFALLTFLLRSPGRTFTRTQICEHVWNYHFDPGTNLVDVYVTYLRKKLGSPGGTPIIETVRNVGYRIPEEKRRP